MKKLISFILLTLFTSTVFANANTVPISGNIPGWPNYLAMGTISNGAWNEHNNIRIDSIFTYNGSGGDGDPGKIENPYKIWSMFNMAKQIRSNTGYPVNPALVEYTWQLSGGWNTDSVLKLDFLTKHFFNLMFLAKTLEDNAYGNTGTDGTILLNPDMLGYLGNTGRVDTVKTLPIHVNQAVASAYCMMTVPVNYNNCTYGWNKKPVELTAGTPPELLAWLRAHTDNYTAGQAFSTCVEQYAMPRCMTTESTAKSTNNIPVFSDNFNGWLQAQNWIVKYAQFDHNIMPDVVHHPALGVHENISAQPGGGWWIHQGPSAVTPYVQSVLADLKSFELFSGKFQPDFIYLDRYGADDYTSQVPSLFINQGTFYNDQDWHNFLTMAKQISEGLGQQANKTFIPVMLWQIPAAHIPTQNEIIQNPQEEGSAPVFFFGDSKLNSDLSNVAPWVVKDINLPSTPSDHYGLCAGKDARQCLTLNGFNWAHQDSNQLSEAVNAHVFAILWGAGGFATGVWEVPGTTFPDGGWMIDKVNKYYKNPVPLHH